MKIIMKKIIALLMAVSIVFAFTACSSKQYKDTEATVPATDSSGVTVTDKNGDTVSEKSESESSTSSSKTTAKSSTKADSSKTTKAEKTNEKSSKSKETTTKKGNKTKNSLTSTTKAQSSTDKQTTTQKPKKRDIKVTVVLPYYNDEDAKLSLNYTLDGKKPESFVSDEKVTLDGKTTKTYTIKNVKGDVLIRADLKGFSAANNVSNNKVSVKSDETSVTIKPLTGIGIADGEDDSVK